MPLGKACKVVAFMGLNDIRLQQGVVNGARNGNAVAAQNMGIVLKVLGKLSAAGAFKPGF